MDLDTTSNYTGEGKGGPDPQERESRLSDINSLPLNTYITYIPNSTTTRFKPKQGYKESLDIHNIPIILTMNPVE